MPKAKPSFTRANVRARLKTRYVSGSGRTEVLFDDDHVIGSIVSYGKFVGGSSRVKSVYGSRIYGTREFGSLKIEEEGASKNSVLDKVAAGIAKAFKDGSIVWKGDARYEPTVVNAPPAPTVK
jgi:hypothetical protein